MHVYLYELCRLGDAKNWNETSCLQFAVLDFFHIFTDYHKHLMNI